MRIVYIALVCLLLVGCGQSPKKAMAQCKNEAQKTTVGMVSNDPDIRTQIEKKQIELTVSCMGSRGFKFRPEKFLSDRYALPKNQWEDDFNQSLVTNSNYWE